MLGGVTTTGAGGFTVRVSLPVVVNGGVLPSTTVNVMGKLPGATGVPERTPAGDKLSPAGSAVDVQVVPPGAFKVWE